MLNEETLSLAVKTLQVCQSSQECGICLRHDIVMCPKRTFGHLKNSLITSSVVSLLDHAAGCLAMLRKGENSQILQRLTSAASSPGNEPRATAERACRHQHREDRCKSVLAECLAHAPGSTTSLSTASEKAERTCPDVQARKQQ